MSGLEQAIRNALERADRANPDIRSRIFQSARNALDAGLRKQDISDPTTIERQRHRLELTIQSIEQEELERLRAAARLEKILIESSPEDDELAAVEPAAIDGAAQPSMAATAAPANYGGESLRPTPVSETVPPPAMVQTSDEMPPETAAESHHLDPDPLDDGSLSAVSAHHDRRPVTDKRAEKRARRKSKRARHEEEDAAWAEPTTPEGAKIAPEKRDMRRRRGSLLVSFFVYSVLLGTILAGVWWVYATGMVGAALNGSSDFDIIPQELRGEDFDPNTEPGRIDPMQSFSGDWVDIYKPEGSNKVIAGPKARFEPVSDSDGAAISIVSEAPDSDGEVRVEVPANVLQTLAGKTSTLAVTLRAEDDLPAQIYIRCEFTTLGDCGRHRFTVTRERADELIQVKFDGKLGPNDPGFIVINSDLTGEGRAIRLYAVRVLPGS